MGTRSKYEPGTFCWIELATTDVDGAKTFYRELFGWSLVDNEIPGGFYTLAQVDGADVAGLFAQFEEQRQAGVPPAWLSHIAVTDADRAAARATELGGNIIAPPFDVMELGRMAVLADPTGAVFAVWQARTHIGAGRVNQPGCLTWNDLATTDVAAATRFYQDLFGWSVEEIDTGGGPRYWSIHHDGAASGRGGGIRELPVEQAQAGVPPHWLPYLVVDSVGDALARANQLGGATLLPTVEIPNGAFAALSDPQGAAVAIYAGTLDD